jgi:hypothetical protein
MTTTSKKAKRRNRNKNKPKQPISVVPNKKTPKRNRTKRPKIMPNYVMQPTGYGVNMNIGSVKTDRGVRFTYPIGINYVSPFFLSTYGSFYLIPIDPYFYEGYPLNLARQFSSVMIKECILNLVPNVGTSVSECQIYYGIFHKGVGFCSSEGTGTYFSDALNTGTGSLFTAWQPQTFVVPPQHLGSIKSVKGSTEDMADYIIICSGSLTNVVPYYVTPIITMDIEFGDPVNNVDVQNFVRPVGFSFSNAGVKRTDQTYGTNAFGYLTGVSDQGFMDEGNCIVLPSTVSGNVSDPTCVPVVNGSVINVSRYTGASNAMLAAFCS